MTGTVHVAAVSLRGSRSEEKNTGLKCGSQFNSIVVVHTAGHSVGLAMLRAELLEQCHDNIVGQQCQAAIFHMVPGPAGCGELDSDMESMSHKLWREFCTLWNQSIARLVNALAGHWHSLQDVRPLRWDPALQFNAMRTSFPYALYSSTIYCTRTLSQDVSCFFTDAMTWTLHVSSPQQSTAYHSPSLCRLCALPAVHLL